MKAIVAVSSTLITLAAGPAALAHTGHVAESAGHSHWLGLAALGLAALVAVRWALKAAARRAAARSRDG